MTEGPEKAPRRHPLLPATRWVVPASIVVGLVGVYLAAGAARLLYVALTVGILALWLLSLLRRPVLLVDEAGYAVAVGRREVLRVRWGEVLRVRAVPSEHAMYVDCGDRARNLLLPGRSGFGFHFARQDALYDFLAERLADRLEIVDKLVPDAPVKNGHNPK